MVKIFKLQEIKIKFVYKVSIELQVWRQAQNKNETSFSKVVVLIKGKFQFKLLNKVNFDLFLQKKKKKHITWKK